MKYVITLQIICRHENYPSVQEVLRRYGFDVPWRETIEISLEKADPRRQEIERELKDTGHRALIDYAPVFEEWEVEQAELLHMFIRALCGQKFANWAEDLGVPSGTRVMDKREMGKQDIALTYGFETVISERLKEILAREGLRGWDAQPIQHRDPGRDRYPALYHLTAANSLPPLAPETELHEEEHTKPLEWPPGHPWHGHPDPLLGTTGLFQRGPLCYRRADLRTIEDFNRTDESFGEATQSHPLLILSQRAWQVFRKHKIRKVDVEPVVILD